MGDADQRDIAAGEVIDLELIRRFIVVAEELNFTRAAARLGPAQPPLSAAIGNLERKLGAQLLERTSRRVTLTPAGAVLLEQGRIAVEGVGAAIERARRTGTQADRLTVAVKPGTGTDLLKQIMQWFAQDPRMPQVHILFGHPERRRLRADLRRRPAPLCGPGLRPGQRPEPQRGRGGVAGHQPLARGGRLRPRGRRGSGQPPRADGRLRLIPALRQPISPNELVRAPCIVGPISYPGAAPTPRQAGGS